jgi:nicotinate-nucleotide--dimethylbenzimidazole phosphoribosyltransferase
MTWALVTGPVRSGKSRFAQVLAQRTGHPVTYVATASRSADDPEWDARLERHRASRPAAWTLVETAGQRSCALTALLGEAPAGRTLLVDSLGTWLADRIAGVEPAVRDDALRLEAALEADSAALASALTACAAVTIVVGEETGWGIVPAFASARIFRDVLGRLQQALAARATHLYLTVSGFAIDLHAAGSLIPPAAHVAEEPAAGVAPEDPPIDPAAWARAIVPGDMAAAARARAHIDALTKPLGALGRLEEIAVQLSAIAGHEPARPYTATAILVAAGDHGVSAENVSAYPAAVTPQMVAAFTGGFAAINALARTVRADLYVADFGVREVPAPHASLFDLRVGAGTANLAREPALGEAAVDAALSAGIVAFERLFERRHYDVVALGEMGIGNTTSAAAVVAALTGARAADIVGYGTGIDAAAFARKVATVERALARFEPRDWRTVAREVGGFEIVGMAGFLIAAARRHVPVVLDGFIVAAAALIACGIAPAIRDYCIAAHVSAERGHRAALAALGLRPLLDLDLRLGEGTGAALALPLVEAASRMVCEMKTFAEAGVATAS